MKTKTTRISIRSIALLMALVLVIGIAFVVPTQAAADTGSLGKLVDHFQSNNSTFTLNNNSRFFLAVEPTGTLLQTVQLAQRQFAADNRPSATPMDIVWGDTKMLRAGDIFVVGCSSSEVAGGTIGKASSPEIAEEILRDIAFHTESSLRVNSLKVLHDLFA